MKIFIFLIFAVAFVSSATKNYYVFKIIKLNWHGAFADCLSRGLQLATVNNQDEHERMKAAITKAKAEVDWLWISATDQAEDRSFVWMSTGKSVSFNKWANGQPDNAFGGEHCTNVWPDNGDFSWNDLRCVADCYYICEDKAPCGDEDDD